MNMLSSISRSIPTVSRSVSRVVAARAFSSFPPPLTTLTEEEEAVRQAGLCFICILIIQFFI